LVNEQEIGNIVPRAWINFDGVHVFTIQTQWAKLEEEPIHARTSRTSVHPDEEWCFILGKEKDLIFEEKRRKNPQSTYHSEGLWVSQTANKKGIHPSMCLPRGDQHNV